MSVLPRDERIRQNPAHHSEHVNDGTGNTASASRGSPWSHIPDQPSATTTSDHSVPPQRPAQESPKLRPCLAAASHPPACHCRQRCWPAWTLSRPGAAAGRARPVGLSTAVPPLEAFEHQEPEDERAGSPDHQTSRVNAALPSVQGIDPCGHEQSPANIGQAQLATPSTSSRSRPGSGTPDQGRPGAVPCAPGGEQETVRMTYSEPSALLECTPLSPPAMLNSANPIDPSRSTFDEKQSTFAATDHLRVIAGRPHELHRRGNRRKSLTC